MQISHLLIQTCLVFAALPFSYLFIKFAYEVQEASFKNATPRIES